MGQPQSFVGILATSDSAELQVASDTEYIASYFDLVVGLLNVYCLGDIHAMWLTVLPRANCQIV